ncbi:hypothetical protein INR49_027365 [Caranx melampygus]|nr:hypothetical protein INR49_027365 [Caranx melampygus]
MRREAGSQVCVNILGQVVEAVEEQTHRSWPRLDLGCGRRYLKLENKEDSVDKLLDQLEQQCSQWDKSFGSGPFQYQLVLKHRQGRSSCSSLLFIYSFLNAASHPPSSSSAPPPPLALTNL